MDKGYYDYDYKEPEREEDDPELSANDDELRDKLKKIGIKPRPQKTLTAEEMQRIAMEEQKLKDHD